MTARVFVPLVGADGSGEQIFVAIAGAAAPEPHPAKLLPQISELYDFGLYKAGQTVREAVTRFADARRADVWLGRGNARVAPWHLRMSDLQVGRLSEENARSAGLGFAVAALLQAFGKEGGVVFATGEIVLPTAPGPAPVAVGPVDGIRGKLMLVGDYLVRHRGALAGTTIHLLLPKTSVEGAPLAEAEARILARLDAEAKAAGATLEVSYLETLDDLERVFGRFRLAEILTRRGAAALAGTAAAAIVVLGGWAALAHAPIRLAWAPVTPANAAELGSTFDDAAPRRARYDAATDTLELLPLCFDAQRQPVVIGGETLLLKVEADDGLPFASRVRPARMFIASVSRAADPILVEADMLRNAGTGSGTGGFQEAVAALPIEAVDDEVRLFVVATRDPDLEASDLLEDLRARLADLDGAAVLTTTASFLGDRFDAAIDYQFKVTSDATECAR